MADPEDGNPDTPAGERGNDPAEALLTALTTEHFALQSAASTTVSESVGRAGLYMAGLSSSLIAIGFTTSSPDLLVPLLATTLPTVFILGVFTVVRLVDTGVQNVAHLADIARIRGYYATLTPTAAKYFPSTAAAGTSTDKALGSMGLRSGPILGLFTIASMIATVNAVVGGVGAALSVRAAFGPNLTIAVFAGLGFAAVCLTLFLLYQGRRYRGRESLPT